MSNTSKDSDMASRTPDGGWGWMVAVGCAIMVVSFIYYTTERTNIVFSRVCDFFFFFGGGGGCYHDNSWKAQPIRTKFSYMPFV